MSLKVEALESGYGRIPAITDVSLTVNRGEIVSLLGGNAAGKSTTLKTIIGFISPWHGSIEFEGELIGGLPCHEIVARGIAIVPENRRLFPRLTVQENLLLGAWHLNRHSSANRVEEVLSILPAVREFFGRYAGTLSGGEQQLVAVARALMSRPRLLLMDEPSMGLAPRLVHQSFALLQQLRDTGIALLVVEQNTDQAIRVSDRCYVLRGGKITLEGTGEELVDNPAVKAAFLGV